MKRGILHHDSPLWKTIPLNGEGILIPKKTTKELSSVKYRAQLCTGFVFTTRTVDNGVMIWRIK